MPARDLLLPFVEPQRPVVQRAGQPEAVLDERQLAAMVAGEHPPDLRHRDVRLVDDQQEVWGEEVEQRVGRLAGLAARQRPASSSRCPGNSPTSSSISMSYRVRAASRCASSSLPCSLSYLQPLVELLADRLDRPWIRSSGSTKCLAG